MKQFPIENGRYIVFLFIADKFKGKLISSDEGEMYWIKKDELSGVNLVDDFNELIQVMLSDSLNEFQYIIDGDYWRVVMK